MTKLLKRPEGEILTLLVADGNFMKGAAGKVGKRKGNVVFWKPGGHSI